MQVVIFSPFSSGPPRGNIISVNRIVRYLGQTGLQVDLIPLDTVDYQERVALLEVKRPDILHGFHCFHTGPECRRVAAQLGIPYIITITGSDIFDPAMRDHPDTAGLLHDAAAIICFDNQVAALVREKFPRAASNLVVIPQGVAMFEEATAVNRDAQDTVILLPAALRAVKGVDFAINELAPLLSEIPGLKLWVAGGALDGQYAKEMESLAGRHDFVTFSGVIPHHKMGGYYLASDIVLNCSLFEGGMANALLEGMVMAKPVVARDIAGNRSIVLNGETGWLFRDGDELRQLVRMIISNPATASAVAGNGQKMVLEKFSPEAEAQALLQLYQTFEKLLRRSSTALRGARFLA